MSLAEFWFVLVAFLFAGYFFLEGFDFGVGMLMPVLGKDDTGRRGYTLVQPATTTAAAVTFLAFFLWGMASHAFGAVQDIRADKGAGIASVATWLGAGATVRLALVGYVLAGALLLLGTTGPGRLAALLVLPYVANVLPFVSVTEGDCESANAGWRRFLTLNYVTGFLVTQLLIWVSLAG